KNRENFPLCIKRLPSSIRCAIPNSRRTASRISGGTEPPPFSRSPAGGTGAPIWGPLAFSEGRRGARERPARGAREVRGACLHQANRKETIMKDISFFHDLVVLLVILVGIGMVAIWIWGLMICAIDLSTTRTVCY